MTPEDRRRMLVAEIEDLSAILEAEGLMSVGVAGQPVPHPAMRERRAALAELRHIEKVIAESGIPVADELDAYLSGR